MNIILILAVFAQAILFNFFHLSSKKLQEKGLSPHAIAGLQRYAIFPAILLFMATYKQEYFYAIIHNGAIIILVLGIMIFWIVGQYAGYFELNSTNSLSLLDAVDATIKLPVLALIGVLINKDIPNIFAIVALIFLAMALIIKPSKSKENKRNIFKYELGIMVGIIVITILAHAINGAMYRNLLHFLSPVLNFGVSLYILGAMIMLNIAYAFKKISKEEKEISSKNKWLAISVPAFWFIASLPEGYSYANIPIFTLISLSSISFLIDIFSDLKNRRIVLNKRTSIFVAMVLISIVFSTISLQ